jgi:hypothetical protein
MNLFVPKRFYQKAAGLTVVLGAANPNPGVLEYLNQDENLTVREAVSAKGVLRALSGANLVILGDLVHFPDGVTDVLEQTLQQCGIPNVSQTDFLSSPQEWIARANLVSAREIPYLPSRQINLINWSGGVGKTTLAMAICKRFCEKTGLPAALLELSMGGSALHARVAPDLPEFYDIATGKSKPTVWNGTSLYPMDGRTIDVLWNDDRQAVLNILAEIKKKNTLFVVDCFPGHPLFQTLVQAGPGLLNLVVTSPRDDAVMQARRLMTEVPAPHHFILNMARTLADRLEGDVSAVLPYNENYAQTLNARLADPLLTIAYPGWNGRR